MSLILRLCNENDIDVVYMMTNDPKVRENAFNTSIIAYEDHYKWYSKSLVNKNRIMYIVEKDKVVVGQIRLDKQENKGIISYSVEKSNRSKGYAKEMLGLIKREAIINNITILEGLVKKNNIASRKAFINNGFIEFEDDEYFQYTYLLKDDDEFEIDKNR